MAIPTICVGDLVNNIMRMIDDGNDEEKIVEEIQNPPFSVITINMEGPFLRNATAEHQGTLLSVMLQLYPSAIIFCQEPRENFKKVVPKTAGFTPRKDKTTTAVVWSTGQFDSTDDLKIEGILDEILKEMEDETLQSRLAMVRLTTTEKPTKSTLAVSYHGPYKGISEEYRRHLLLRLLDQLVENHKDSFIVGGDFNLDTTQLNMEKFSNHVNVGEYDLTPRASEAKKKSPQYIAYKDNFFWSTKITIREIEALEDAKYDRFDHDPIVGRLVFEENGKSKEPRTSPTR